MIRSRSGKGTNAIKYALVFGVVMGALFAYRNATPTSYEINPTEVQSSEEFDSLETEGLAIQERLKEWKVRAIAAGLDTSETVISLTAMVNDIEPAACGKLKPCDCPKTTPQVKPLAGRGDIEPALRTLLAEVANDKSEVMLALANGVMICKNTTICWWNGGNILKSWLDITFTRHHVRNLLVGVLDDETWIYMDQKFPDVKKFRPKVAIPSSQDGTHPANRVSTLKYGLLKQVLQAGYHVLVSDMDLVYLEDPFLHLHRDSDIEGQTDGFTERWSYGSFGSIHDPSMGWGAGGLYLQMFTLNVGCMYVRSTERSVDLMARVNHRLLTASGWDQQVFNEEVLYASHGEVSRAQVSVRVMDYLLFANSKTFFRSERAKFFPGVRATTKPLMIHMNYHPDKHNRMLCIMERYFDNRADACDTLPQGSEVGTR
mmetsp:Transcript_41612/g.69529  ORF Transcript_41612/g.69529 Transcript_41612/m.69529 type:complete len:430 (+) Transcript_41612:191-1480(+)|eukprot:CAMPEP_0198224306 /NCGR_PEP_ID=MMETSP1445-20131203/96352_1 /TAXON_ID=36898 /ORGANISM="Pyramimonas sp., Strain CCMP2087" /LENGTH=429 /DNA_ID=CAMNT_0043903431 /DNA_START=170 /DNA_END=1459 /DNA_ORIENTATION=+